MKNFLFTTTVICAFCLLWVLVMALGFLIAAPFLVLLSPILILGYLLQRMSK